MASARRETIGSALRAARTRAGASPSPSPTASHSSPSSSARPRRIVGTSSLRAKPTSTIEAPTAFDFFNDPDVLVTTPVEEGREEEFRDQLSYAFTYGSDLVSFLKSAGFKLPTGYTLDNATADADFAAFTTGLAHVMFPISYAESAKLLDLEHDYDFYHSTVNEILFCLLPHPLRGNALSVYHECARTHPADGRYALQRLRYEVEGVPDADGMRYWTQMRAIILSETVDPAPQLATIRRLCERHHKLKPAYSDSDRVADLWHILSESAKKSPYVAPLYLVVLRELRSGHLFTFDRLALRIRLAFRDESPLATLSSPPSPDTRSEGSGYRPKTATQKPQTPDPPGRPTAMALRAKKQSDAPLDGKWVADNPTSLYLKWSGTGFPCAVCFRVWGVTDAHPDTRGACPFVCIEAFANNKHLVTSKPAPPRPPLDPPPADTAPAPPAVPAVDAAVDAAFRSVRLLPPAPGGGDTIDDDDGDALVVPTAEDLAPPLPDEPVGAALAFQDEDTDWPALRSSPVWVPHIPGAGVVIGTQLEPKP
ncbi:hypothetical protein CYMTET_31757 [Cymbomonas tetramitiformis]|uniref:Uncharacterized protein n=1 Tax=Cymbomonas tetramitiformis TaxID=36881 RepID=A0AAE0FGI4_9CHLO|nr:hypothetical protein CYMTET_31757 [Cymbomonas tetramitiformis]